MSELSPGTAEFFGQYDTATPDTPEFYPGIELTAGELLEERSPDPFGYVAQAAAILSKPVSRSKPDRYMAVAEYASDTQDSELMKACLESGHLDDAAKWRVFVHEQRNNNYAMDVPAIQGLGEGLVELETADESECDYLALSDIYASQLEIALGSSDSNIDARIKDLTLMLEKAVNVKTGESRRNEIRNRVVHSLLKAGEFEQAESFANKLSARSKFIYEDSLPLYRRYQQDKSLASASTIKTHHILRDLAPTEFITKYDCQDAADVKALLKAGELTRAQHLYEHLLEGYTSNSDEHLQIQMALWLARYTQSEATDEKEADIIGEMEGFRKQVHEPSDNGFAMDIAASIEHSNHLEQRLLRMRERLRELPLSSQRFKLELELASLQKQTLPQSEKSRRLCGQMLGRTRYVLTTIFSDTTSDETRAELEELSDLFNKPD